MTSCSHDVLQEMFFVEVEELMLLFFVCC